MKMNMKNNENNESFELRPMLASDIDEVHALEKEIFFTPWSRHSFEVEVQLPFSHSYVVQAKEGIAAYIVAWLVEDELHITNVAVNSAFRRKGLASKMLNHVLDIAIKSKCKQVNLEVRKSNEEAIRIYQKLGFQIIGVRKNYYTAEQEDALVMSLKLASN
jgi:[ribosomal protein S18]-alanine N-acetyltransferase